MGSLVKGFLFAAGMLLFLVFLVVVVGVAISNNPDVLSGDFADVTRMQPDSDPPITLRHYNQLQTGMSYADTVRVLGIDGEQMSRNEMVVVPGQPAMLTVMYLWQNDDGSNMNVMFQNDKIV